MKNEKKDPGALIDALVHSSGGKINRSQANEAANGDPSALLAALSAEDREKLNRVMNDKSALQKLLAGKDAQELLKRLSGKNGNG